MAVGIRNIAFLSDDNGLVLTLTSMKVGGETEVKYPSTFSHRVHPGERRAGERNQSALEGGRFRGTAAKSAAPVLDIFTFQAPGGFTIEVLG